jgi:hypothetical protein
MRLLAAEELPHAGRQEACPSLGECHLALHLTGEPLNTSNRETMVPRFEAAKRFGMAFGVGWSELDPE